MLIRTRRSWDTLQESEATPEAVFFNRRALLAGSIAMAAAPAVAQRLDDDPSMASYPFPKNARYTLDRSLTEEAAASSYNNFYEYGTSKSIARAAQALKTRPWTVVIDGLVEKPMEVGIDDLIKAMPKEERLYRFRCVETWAMAVPWSGFAFKALLDYAKPLSGAKFVRMETFLDPKMAPGQRNPGYPFPYVEGLTIEEAANDLAFLVTGVYGKPAQKQFGAPLRLAVPWKYGFKSVKSIRKFTFTDKQPVSLWEQLQPMEYGFWANVNPEVPHPRWSQATEELLGTGKRVPTQLYNGYAAEVAGLYTSLKGERLFT
ncbi:MAG: protein-methionine-sulfoxide reductase catalytic subunit MsrP [Proteobacteria bacterium]|nr:protein-methionine-sulfoxide reductase catalytic subunit MsrP [Pseudomonadota bacterium]